MKAAFPKHAAEELARHVVAIVEHPDVPDSFHIVCREMPMDQWIKLRVEQFDEVKPYLHEMFAGKPSPSTFAFVAGMHAEDRARFRQGAEAPALPMPLAPTTLYQLLRSKVRSGEVLHFSYPARDDAAHTAAFAAIEARCASLAQGR